MYKKTQKTSRRKSLTILMMRQGNACQVYPKVISLYSEPPHAIAWAEISINIANNTNMVWLAFGLLWFGPVNFCLIKCVTKTRQIYLHYHLHHPRNCQMESEFWNVQPSMGHFCPNMVTPRGSLRLAIILYILHYADANCDINSFMS